MQLDDATFSPRIDIVSRVIADSRPSSTKPVFERLIESGLVKEQKLSILANIKKQVEKQECVF